jgi:hypothetical protein
MTQTEEDDFRCGRFGHLDFEIGACLEFGAWDLEFVVAEWASLNSRSH